MSGSKNQIEMVEALWDQKYQVAEDILLRKVENEAILLHITSGTYYSLNETSILFWQAICEAKSLPSVIEEIIKEYQVESEQAWADLAIFVQDLLNYGLIFPATN